MSIDRITDLYREGGLGEIRRGISDFFRLELLSQIGPRLPSESIWSREWDILCVLDGCRLDTFRETIDEDCGRFRSVGSTSQTWIPRTFNHHDVSDVAYVTGNPFSVETNTDDFGLYREVGVAQVEGVETVPPKKLTDYAIEIWRNRDQHSIDRMVIHYMQPHVPFRSQPEWFNEWINTDTWGSSAWNRIRTGEITREEFFDAYRDNLNWVWEDGVIRLKKNCNGKIAITADHGNAAGEFGYYGHPRGAPVSSVRHVPWKTISGTDIGTVTPEVNLNKSHDERDVEASLEALGYK